MTTCPIRVFISEACAPDDHVPVKVVVTGFTGQIWQAPHRPTRPMVYTAGMTVGPKEQLPHDLSRTPALAKQVMRRLERSTAQGSRQTLRPHQEGMVRELLENGRSVEEVAQAFDVCVIAVRRLIE